MHHEGPNSPGIPCSEFTTSHVPVSAGQLVYLVVGRGNAAAGIAGLSCGIRYDATIGMQAWLACADLEFPRNGWPASGGGNRILWRSDTNCQRTVVGFDGAHAVAGVMYVYAYGAGTMEVTPNYGIPPQADFTVMDCLTSESNVRVRGGSIGFGTAWGVSTCIEADGGCWFGSDTRHCCCKPGSSEDLGFWSSREQFCEHEGGRIVTGPCRNTCAEICAAVAARAASWGWIKARF